MEFPNSENHNHFPDLVDEYQQYQDATAEDDDDEEYDEDEEASQY